MAMDHQPKTFPLFSSLPAELRLLIFEQALLPLIEPRIVAVHRDINDPSPASWRSFHDCFSFSVVNRAFLRATEPFITSAATLRQVCTESRDVVESFRTRFGLPGPQPAFESPRLNGLLIGARAPLRPQGPHADIFLSDYFSLVQHEDAPLVGPANSDVGLAKRWLMPMGNLWDDLESILRHNSTIRLPLLESQHDIIALAFYPGDPDSLKYSDLVIVPADTSVVIPGLENDRRDFIAETFKQIKRIIDNHEERRLERSQGLTGVPPRRVCPNLYFAYVNPLKRRESPHLTAQ